MFISPTEFQSVYFLVFTTFSVNYCMQIAILSDIHSNLPALEAIFSYLKSHNIEKIFCLGDIVGYGPFPNECIELVRQKCFRTISGNHDLAQLKKIPIKNFNKMGKKTLLWTEKIITEENKKFLETLPLNVIWQNLTFVHASPLNPENFQYIFTYQEAEEAFRGFKTSICFIGHTHIPALISEDLSSTKLEHEKRFIINVGSVGQPRDGIPKTSFGIFDTKEWMYQNIRLEYDIQKTIDALKKFKLPSILSRRLIIGL